MLLSCMTLDAKPWAYELNSDLKNKSDRTLCNLWIHIWTNRLQVYLQVTFSRTTKSYQSQTCFNNIFRIYLNEKLNFYHHIIERNAQMHITLENLVYYNNLFINFEIKSKSSIQYGHVTIFYCRDISEYLYSPSTIRH